MRFAILGNHPDGLALARALVASGRHQLLTCTTPLPPEYLRHSLPQVQRVDDLEEVLADPAIEAVLVAGSLANRPTQLRRALQSERHVLCFHPADRGPDVAYEAAMIQRDTHCVLLPLLPEALHPGVRRLAELCRPKTSDHEAQGGLRLVEMERWSSSAVLIDDGAGRKLSLPGWDVLRTLGGEIAEVTAFAEREELTADRPVFLSGRFERGGLLQVSLVPGQPETRWRLAVQGPQGRGELVLFDGLAGRAVLTWHDEGGRHEQTWEGWDPWQALVEVFEAAVNYQSPVHAGRAAQSRHLPATRTATDRPNGVATFPGMPTMLPAGSPLLTWQDEVRCLELDEAARRSVERRRASTLEYPDATEEAGVKGTMTLLGCGMLWVILLLLILSVWFPWLGWFIGPVLVLFLVLQLFLWSVGRQQLPAASGEGRSDPEQEARNPESQA